MPQAIEIQAVAVKTTTYTLLVPTRNNWDEMIITVDVSATDTPTTLLINYEVSPDEGVTWVKHTGTADQDMANEHIKFTTVNETRATFITSNPGEYGRLNLVITGTSYTTQIWVEGRALRGKSGLVK